MGTFTSELTFGEYAYGSMAESPGISFKTIQYTGGSTLALVLDFTTGALDSRITFTRASSGTYFDASGVLQLATTNTARFDHNPVTLAAKGLLIEESRTNLFPYSTNINVNWSAANDASVDAYAAAPDGTTTATRVLDNSAGGTGVVGHAMNATITNTRHCFSFFAKSEQLSWVSMQITGFTSATLAGVAYFDLQNGVVGATNQIEATIQNCGNGWYRCVGYVVPDAGDLSGNFTICCADTNNDYVVDRDGTSSILIWGVQLEAGSFPTSYIPTAGSTVTRAADNAIITGSNFSSWFNASEGTFVVIYRAEAYALGARILGASDGTTANRIRLYEQASTLVRVDMTSSSVSQCLLDNTITDIDSATHKTAVSYKADDFATCSDAGSVATDTSGVVPVGLNVLALGAYEAGTGGSYFNGHIATLSYYSSRLPDATLQSLTA